MSRQLVQWHAGHKDASFDLDKNLERCQEINQASLDWALKNADQHAMQLYNKYGQKMVIVEDSGPYNAGPLWIWTYLKYEDNADKTEVHISSPTMYTALDFWEVQVQGEHYCKLLSPYRALEWIYVDSQK